jgi:osmoprotectant transport system permease protein
MPGAPRPDRLGALLCGGGVIACLWLPFVLYKGNRILPGVPHGMYEALPPAVMPALLAALVLAAAGALFARDARWRLAGALLGLAALAFAVGAAGTALTPAGNKVVRVAPASGFWLLLLCLALLATDAVTRLRPRPGTRVILLAGMLALLWMALASGHFDDLSFMREYAVNAERFARELRAHALLALGSLAAAALFALPLGLLCHRLPRLRGAALGVLNLVQTIPAIALFGILMAPLAALAAASPLAAALGIRGIGAAPAVIALFLYSLLPIVANTVAGLARVSPAAVEAARGMGMTAGQILARVELPLALPVILTGVRIVLVQNIGLVTVAALIGAGGLGAFVFQGIGQTAIDLVLLGALPIILLAFCAAVLLDALIEVIDKVPA